MQRTLQFAVGASLLAVALAAPAQKPSAYPAKGQSATQQSKDDGECLSWAKQNTGVDPSKPHTISFDFRPEAKNEIANAEFRSRYQIFGNSSLPNGDTSTATTWWVVAAAGTTGSAPRSRGCRSSRSARRRPGRTRPKRRPRRGRSRRPRRSRRQLPPRRRSRPAHQPGFARRRAHSVRRWMAWTSLRWCFLSRTADGRLLGQASIFARRRGACELE